MPQLIIAAVLVVGGLLAWRVVKREMARVGREVERARGLPTETLTQDPKTGRYRVKDKR
jgi:hypothetical protein